MSRLGVKLLVLFWAGSIVVGLTAMLDYEFTPSQATAAACEWPSSSHLRRGQNCPTLLMFVHPRCPCSRASLVELGKLVPDCRTPLALRIVLIRPTEFEEGWERTSLYSLAQRIPGAVVVTDPDADEAARFGVTTSGETLLYTSEGKLIFQGGLTASRGHEGNSAGHDALKKLIGAHGAPPCHTSVFGCALRMTTPPERGPTNP